MQLSVSVLRYWGAVSTRDMQGRQPTLAIGPPATEGTPTTVLGEIQTCQKKENSGRQPVLTKRPHH